MGGHRTPTLPVTTAPGQVSATIPSLGHLGPGGGFGGICTVPCQGAAGGNGPEYHGGGLGTSQVPMAEAKGQWRGGTVGVGQRMGCEMVLRHPVVTPLLTLTLTLTPTQTLTFTLAPLNLTQPHPCGFAVPGGNMSALGGSTGAKIVAPGGPQHSVPPGDGPGLVSCSPVLTPATPPFPSLVGHGPHPTQGVLGAPVGCGALALVGSLATMATLGGLFPTAGPPNEEQMGPAGVF